jgi:hypothetical protein
MVLFNKIFSFYQSKSFVSKVQFLFLLWLLTLPFGSNLFHFSFGFFTIFPNLVLTFALLPLALLVIKTSKKLDIIFIVYLFIWTIFEIVVVGMNGVSKEALFDLRSLLMQFFIATTLIGIYQIIGKNGFLHSLVIGLRCFLFILLCAGVIEFLTGIHFASQKTTELMELPVGNIFYAPMFIYQNPNDYLVYVIFIFLVLNLFDEKIRNHSWFKILIFLIIFIFSVFADSNFAKLISSAIIVISAVEILSDHLNSGYRRASFYAYLTVFVCFIMTLFTNPLFIGPKYHDGASYRLNGLSIIEEKNNQISVLTAKEAFSKSKQKRVIQYLDSIHTKSPNGSSNIRKNLIFNGIDFIKSEPVFGLGPGGFARKLKYEQQKYYIGTQTSPHHFPIEVISQYGIFGWFYFLFLLFISIRLLQLHKKLDCNYKVALLLLFLSIPVLWMMPSAFLYLNIHCLFLPLMLIQLNMISEKPNLDDIRQ